MKSDVYRLVTVSDGKADTATIAQIFSAMSTGRLKSDLQLLNYYNEVPVSYSASLISVDDDSVELCVHEHQALIMKHDKATLVKSRHFQNELGVHCYATYVNTTKKTVVLQNFAYAQIRAERREAVRVKVNRPIRVEFEYEGSTIAGSMIDISGNGLSILADGVTAAGVNQEGHLNFTMAGTSLLVPGALVKSTPLASGGTINVFRMNPGRQADTVIGQFIYQRQVEIIQELKDGLVEG